MSKYLIIPLSGNGKRFTDIGVTEHKQLLRFDDNKSPFFYSLKSFDNLKSFIILIGIKDKSLIHTLSEELEKIDKDLKFRFIYTGKTKSPVDTVRKIINLYDKPFSNNSSFTIFTMDIYVPTPIKISVKKNISYTFQIEDGPHSFVKINKYNQITQCKEKIVISELANAGIFCISGYKNLINILFSNSLNQQKIINFREESIAELFLNNKKTKFESKFLKQIYIFGTPEEWTFFNNNILPQLTACSKKSICIIPDHSGIVFAKKLFYFFKKNNIDVKIINNQSISWEKSINHHKEFLLKSYYSENKIIISTCKSGLGVSRAISDVLGTYVPIIKNLNHLKLTINHSACRAFSIPSGFHQEFLKSNKLISILSEKFDGGRHQRRLINYHNNLFNDFKKSNLNKYKSGWFFGYFKPSITNTSSGYEIAIKQYKNGVIKPDNHYHDIGEEITVILEGKGKSGNRFLKEGDIIIQRPLETDKNTFSKNTKILVIRKTPRSPKKKYYLGK